IAGQFDSSSPFTGDYEVAPRSLSDITFLNPAAGVTDEPLRSGLWLMPSAPNPFSDAAEILYRLPAGQGVEPRVPVRLRVFDLRGRVVATLVDGLEEPGEHAVRLERRSLKDAGSGIYFYRLEVP